MAGCQTQSIVVSKMPDNAFLQISYNFYLQIFSLYLSHIPHAVSNAATPISQDEK
jgi:hypothetical protein